MHRATLAILIAGLTSGCTATQLGIPDWPLGPPPQPTNCSLKDDCKPAAQPTNAPASVVRPLSP